MTNRFLSTTYESLKIHGQHSALKARRKFAKLKARQRQVEKINRKLSLK